MTKLVAIDPDRIIAADKLAWLHVAARSTSGDLIVQLSAEGIYLHRAGSREKFLLPWGHAYLRAALLEADRQRAERKAKRQRKR
jgi:hypothetical protein